MEMLITNLGQARTKLLKSFMDFNDDRLNEKQYSLKTSIASIIQSLSAFEKDIATDILNALGHDSETIAEQDLSNPSANHHIFHIEAAPQNNFLNKHELIRLLEESRFKYLQQVFNETHEYVLADKSTTHPKLGRISLKNLVDCIWLRDQFYTQKIEFIAASTQESEDIAHTTNIVL